VRGSFTHATCVTPACGRPARSSFYKIGASKWCERCQKRVRRQGDARQAPVRRHEVHKIVTRLKRLVKWVGKVEQVEQALQQIARNLVSVTVDDLPQPAPNGKAKPWTNQWMERAMDELQRVCGDIEAVASGYLVVAMFVMQQDERPPRFVSDEAFRFQLVRMWRCQTSLSVGTTYDAKRDRVVGWYKILPPRVVLYLAEILTTAYAPVVGYVMTLIKNDEERRRLPLLTE